jgi:hypothetical protein
MFNPSFVKIGWDSDIQVFYFSASCSSSFGYVCHRLGQLPLSSRVGRLLDLKLRHIVWNLPQRLIEYTEGSYQRFIPFGMVRRLCCFLLQGGGNMRGLQEYITLILRCPLQCQDVEMLAGLWADFVVSSRQHARSKERFRMQDRVNGQHDVGRGWVKGQRPKSLMVSYGLSYVVRLILIIAFPTTTCVLHRLRMPCLNIMTTRTCGGLARAYKLKPDGICVGDNHM